MFYCQSRMKKIYINFIRSYIENKAALFTIDGCGQSYFDCGVIPEVYATVDFGISSNASQCFDFMRKVQKGGPLVNSEFYPGWLTHWQESVSIVNPIDVVKQMKVMLAINASFKIFGTNFGFTSGANTNDTKESIGYLPQLTSYDYNAPLDEAVDPTEKYFNIKQTLEEAKYAVTNEISPNPAPKGAYGKFYLRPLVSIFEKVAQRIKPVISDVPLPFEDLDINTGFVMYETTLTDDQKNVENPVNLTVNTVRDRAIIYLDQVELHCSYSFRNMSVQIFFWVQVGTMNRLKANTTISLNINRTVQNLSILIENQGRMNFGDLIEDRKGIFDQVILGNKILSPWKMTAYPLNGTLWISSIKSVENVNSVKLPAFYKTQFTLTVNYTKCLDTYLDTSGWTKGVVFLNNVNLGRYWPLGGPQVTLYVPAPFLKPSPYANTLVILELEGTSQDLSVKFVDKPVLDGPIMT
ncbi:beta-galactosidase-like [Metopolophium dirhodum]|uniref:beta-galactosidase-like n=1 Tax=Metopolophium dirhodum TaxID=44670 RepID=UPI00298F5785|nr:beta-galactosidase-like [Metopolophium dirhodum]